MSRLWHGLSGGSANLVVWNETIPVDIVNAVFRGRRPASYEWQDDEIPVFHHQSWIVSHRLGWNQIPVMRYRMAKCFERVKRKLGGRPDLVWCVTLSSAILWDEFARLTNETIPFFLQEHSNPLQMHLKTNLQRSLAAGLVSRVKAVTIVAERQLVEFKNLWPNARPIIIPNPADTVFVKQYKRKASFVNNLIYVGRLSEEKGVVRLIKALSILQKNGIIFRCCIVGDGPQKSDILKLIHDLRLTDYVVAVGAKPAHQIADYLNESAFFVLPSFYENCPVALIEAQVMGLPCVVTENNASEKILLPGNGITVADAGEGVQLADGIRQMYSVLHNYDRHEIRERALRVFAPEVFAASMYKIMQQVYYKSR